MEFGTGTGTTAKIMSSARKEVIYTFDSFEGLPDVWLPGIFDKGAFKQDKPKNMPENVSIIEGLIQETLPNFLELVEGVEITGGMKIHQTKISVLHLDCDMYPTTKVKGTPSLSQCLPSLYQYNP